MEKELKGFRLEIDGLAQLTKGLMIRYRVNDDDRKEGESGQALINRAIKEGFAEKMNDNSLEIDNAMYDLYFAKFWCGKALGSLGTPSPYVNDGKRKEVADIEPTDSEADLSDYYVQPLDFEHKNHIEKVDWLRQEIQRLIDQWDLTYRNNLDPDGNVPGIIAQQIHVHLTEARGWLGFELERIREEAGS